MYYHSNWGTICHFGSYDNNIPDVVCHQLGYAGGSSGSSSDTLLIDPVIGSVSCSSTYLTILQCSYATNPSGCSYSDQVAVTCYSTRLWDNPYTGMVRLQIGHYTGQGRVEVYCNNQWGVVCNSESIDYHAATTICTQLGYNDYISFLPILYSGIAWLNNVDCISQSCLSACTGGSCPSSNVTCSNASVVFVVCFYNTSKTILGSTTNTCQDINDSSSGSIVGVVLGVIFTVLFYIAFPLCICCCCIYARNRHSCSTSYPKLLIVPLNQKYQ